MTPAGPVPSPPSLAVHAPRAPSAHRPKPPRGRRRGLDAGRWLRRGGDRRHMRIVSLRGTATRASTAERTGRALCPTRHTNGDPRAAASTIPERLASTRRRYRHRSRSPGWDRSRAPPRPVVPVPPPHQQAPHPRIRATAGSRICGSPPPRLVPPSPGPPDEGNVPATPPYLFSKARVGPFPELRAEGVLRSSPVRGTSQRGTKRGPGG